MIVMIIMIVMIVMIIMMMMMVRMGDGFAGHSASGLAFLLLGNWFAVMFHHHRYHH